MSRRAPCLGVVVALLLVACSEPEPAKPYVDSGDMAYFMGHLLDPAADVIWRSAGTISTLAGEEDLAPTTDEGWFQVEHSAVVITEAANLLMQPERRQSGADWVEYSVGLGRVGKQLIAAAEAQDKDAIFELGGELYNVCVACHQRYWPESPR